MMSQLYYLRADTLIQNIARQRYLGAVTIARSVVISDSMIIPQTGCAGYRLSVTLYTT